VKEKIDGGNPIVAGDLPDHLLRKKEGKAYGYRPHSSGKKKKEKK